jgi:hypothetical protein
MAHHDQDHEHHEGHEAHEHLGAHEHHETGRGRHAAETSGTEEGAGGEYTSTDGVSHTAGEAEGSYVDTSVNKEDASEKGSYVDTSAAGTGAEGEGEYTDRDE